MDLSTSEGARRTHLQRDSGRAAFESRCGCHRLLEEYEEQPLSKRENAGKRAGTGQGCACRNVADSTGCRSSKRGLTSLSMNSNIRFAYRPH